MKKTIVLALFFLLSSCSSASADEIRYSVPVGDSPVLGPPNAPITIIEFLDYQ